MKSIIRKNLKEIEETENVKIIMAIESGSRAWGFESPDSDYDVRFVYVRKIEDYLKLEKSRDVIEYQLDDVFDINGWDLKKALQLIHDSNPSIFEWCTSPIVYKRTDEFEVLKRLCEMHFSTKKSLYHYLHMTNRTYQDYLCGDEVRVKKYFYAIRPLLAAKWVMEKKSQPPMLFPELVEAELPMKLRPIIDELLKMKKLAPEIGVVPRIEALDEFIRKEVENIKQVAEVEASVKNDWEQLDKFFWEQVRIC